MRAATGFCHRFLWIFDPQGHDDDGGDEDADGYGDFSIGNRPLHVDAFANVMPSVERASGRRLNGFAPPGLFTFEHKCFSFVQ